MTGEVLGGIVLVAFLPLAVGVAIVAWVTGVVT